MQPEIRRSVKRMNEYVVRFSTLINEHETVEFSLEEKFFAFFESEIWKEGKIKVIATVSKRTDGITFDMTLKGALLVTCDRCLDSFWMDIETREKLYVKFGSEPKELDDHTVIVPREENEVDLGSFFYDYLVLALPVKKVHPETPEGTSGCNRTMIEKLNEHIVETENDETDPRWEELKKLLDKN